MTGCPFDKFDESNELSPPKLSHVDHEVPNEPEHALNPTSYAYNWELHAADRSDWRSVYSLALQAGEERLKAEAVDRRAKRRAEMNKATCVPVACVFVCSGCGRVCRSRIGLFSHERKCLS